MLYIYIHIIYIIHNLYIYVMFIHNIYKCIIHHKHIYYHISRVVDGIPVWRGLNLPDRLVAFGFWPNWTRSIGFTTEASLVMALEAISMRVYLSIQIYRCVHVYVCLGLYYICIYIYIIIYIYYIYIYYILYIIYIYCILCFYSTYLCLYTMI